MTVRNGHKGAPSGSTPAPSSKQDGDATRTPSRANPAANQGFNPGRQRWLIEPPILRLLDRYLVWLVALLASLEAFGAVAQGVADDRLDHAVI